MPTPLETATVVPYDSLLQELKATVHARGNRLQSLTPATITKHTITKSARKQRTHRTPLANRSNTRLVASKTASINAHGLLSEIAQAGLSFNQRQAELRVQENYVTPRSRRRQERMHVKDSPEDLIHRALAAKFAGVNNTVCEMSMTDFTP
jgi:hypothetical protein